MRALLLMHGVFVPRFPPCSTSNDVRMWYLTSFCLACTESSSRTVQVLDGPTIGSCPAAQLRCRQGPNGPNEKDPRPSDGEKAKICEDTQAVTNIGLSIDFQYLLANILSYIYSNHYIASLILQLVTHTSRGKPLYMGMTDI